MKFVHTRKHHEGGFALYKGIPDTKKTYYGLKTLEMFNDEPNNKEQIIKWIQKLQKYRMYGIQGVFYRINILNMFNEEIIVLESYIARLNAQNEFANLEVAYYHTVISNILNLNNFSKVINGITSHQNEDEEFGIGRSDIVSTYYTVESLNLIDSSLIKMNYNITEFICECLTQEGGFTFIPDIYPPDLKPTYSGIRIRKY